jgi:hypothetical protein
MWTRRRGGTLSSFPNFEKPSTDWTLRGHTVLLAISRVNALSNTKTLASLIYNLPLPAKFDPLSQLGQAKKEGLESEIATEGTNTVARGATLRVAVNVGGGDKVTNAGDSVLTPKCQEGGGRINLGNQRIFFTD